MGTVHKILDRLGYAVGTAAVIGTCAYCYKMSGMERNLPNSLRLDGKTIVVTGGSSGIGETVVTNLVLKHGANVIIPTRSMKKCENVKKLAKERYDEMNSDSIKMQILKKLSKPRIDKPGEDYSKARDQFKFDDPTGKIDCIYCDLKKFQDVVNFAEQISKVDVLINNAAILKPKPNTTITRTHLAPPKVNSKRLVEKEFEYKYAKTEHGIEEQLQVNHLSHFLLSNLLKHKLTQSAEPLIINVTCESATSGEFKVEDIERLNTIIKEEVPYAARGNELYRQSKLANVLFTKEASKRWLDIKNISVDPGTSADTDLGRSDKSDRMITTFNKVLHPAIWFLKFRTSGQTGQAANRIIYHIFSKNTKNGCHYVGRELALELLEIDSYLEWKKEEDERLLRESEDPEKLKKKRYNRELGNIVTGRKWRFYDFTSYANEYSELLWNYSNFATKEYLEVDGMD